MSSNQNQDKKRGENDTARHRIDQYVKSIRASVRYEYTAEGPAHNRIHICTVFINEEVRGTGSGNNKAEAKEAACQAAGF